MSLLDSLKAFRSKYKDNDYRLSQEDSSKTRELLMKALQELEPSPELINFVIDFPPDIGISVYAEHYQQSDSEKRQKLNDLLFSNEKFHRNENFIGVRRGADLINRLLAAGVPRQELKAILKEINRLILREASPFNENQRHQKLLQIFEVKIGKEEEKKYKKLETKKQELQEQVEAYQRQQQHLQSVLAGLRHDIQKMENLKKKLKNN